MRITSSHDRLELGGDARDAIGRDLDDAGESTVAVTLDPDQMRSGAKIWQPQWRMAHGFTIDEDIAAGVRID
jgi:hypothetical protein